MQVSYLLTYGEGSGVKKRAVLRANLCQQFVARCNCMVRRSLVRKTRVRLRRLLLHVVAQQK